MLNSIDQLEVSKEPTPQKIISFSVTSSKDRKLMKKYKEYADSTGIPLTKLILRSLHMSEDTLLINIAGSTNETNN